VAGRRGFSCGPDLNVWPTLARMAGTVRPKWYRTPSVSNIARPAGISVVIPSRNGRHLLEAQLAGIEAQAPSEIIVVDNGSDDGTAEWLRARWLEIQVEHSAVPLSFSRAVNRGIRQARYSHVCLLNNDMLIEPGFFTALRRAFERVPDLFCATAQIRFPEGVRREETGKAVMARSSPDDFPVRCDEPLEGEDLTWVLYGSGGCSLYDAAMLGALGDLDECYEPAYVEDMDIGWRAWQQGWPTVYVAGALVEHRHRATTSRYYSAAELERVLEINYLRFLVRAVDSRALFRRLWREALERLERRFPELLRQAPRIVLDGGRMVRVLYPEEAFLALTEGSVAVFPGEGTAGVLLQAVDALERAAPELVHRFNEVVMVRGTPDGAAFQVALELSARKWPAATLWSAAPGESARPVRTR
jgi:O-antigen biosynthesis protein